MVYKRFGIRVTVYVVLITALSLACCYCTLQGLYLTAGFLCAALLITAFSFIHFVQRTNRELSRLLLAIKYNDFSQRFPKEGGDDSYGELYNSFNEILSAFRKTRLEKEEQFQYLQTVIEHVGISLVAFDESGNVELYNNAAKQILGIPYLRNIADLDRLHPGLSTTFSAIKPGEQVVVKMNEDTHLQQLALRVEDFIINKRRLRLASLQDIRTELERKELDTWQKMIRVLTHEIMNSVTPITSLSSSLIGFLEHEGQPKDNNRLSNENIEDALRGLYTIRERSEGLTSFVQRYRALMRVPQPALQAVGVKSIYQHVAQLMQEEFNKAGVVLELRQLPEHMSINADPGLMEQVLINILKNALQATQGRPGAKVELSASYIENESNRVLLKINDNGYGIAEEIQDKVLIPFFSTKEGGSGIGLSLSQQIILAHGGSLQIYSKQDIGTTVSVVMPAGNN